MQLPSQQTRPSASNHDLQGNPYDQLLSPTPWAHPPGCLFIIPEERRLHPKTSIGCVHKTEPTAADLGRPLVSCQAAQEACADEGRFSRGVLGPKTLRRGVASLPSRTGL